MSGRKFIKYLFCCAFIAGAVLAVRVAGFSDKMRPELDVPYEPTPPPVIQAMLSVAGVGKGDVHYDLGCGDGRIVVMAVRNFGAARGVGVDLDPQRLMEAKERATAYGVIDKVRFIQGNIMDVDASKANVVSMYLLNSVNFMIRPKLFQELQPGTRCVAHAFHMSDWEVDKLIQHPKARNKTINLWIIPAHLGGTWKWETKTPNETVRSSANFVQTFQRVSGAVNFDGTRDVNMADPFVEGKSVSFTARVNYKGAGVDVKYQGIAEGDIIRGTQEWKGGQHSGKYVWFARREPAGVLGTWEVTSGGALTNMGGTLTLKKAGNKIAASYYVKSEGREEGIRQVYVWGNSVYFRVPLFGRDADAVFTGTLDNNAASGKVFRVTKNQDEDDVYGPASTWTARKAR